MSKVIIEITDDNEGQVDFHVDFGEKGIPTKPFDTLTPAQQTAINMLEYIVKRQGLADE